MTFRESFAFLLNPACSKISSATPYTYRSVYSYPASLISCRSGVPINRSSSSSPTKSIWLYTGYTWNQIINHHSAITDEFDYIEESYINSLFEKRKEIVSKCDVLIDGRYIEQQRNITLKWRGSENQNVIDIQKSLIEGRKVLWCN